MQQLALFEESTPGAAQSARVLREIPTREQPRARLEYAGAGALSLMELLALVLDCKTDPLLPARLLAEFTTLDELARADSADWARVSGVTPLRAARLAAALELHKRFGASGSPDRVRIKSPADAAAVLAPEMSVLAHEEMRVLILNTKNDVIGPPLTIYRGSVHTTVVRTSELFRAATQRNATAIVLAHNHPTGDPEPSPEDVATTREIVQAGKILDIDVLDHLVIGAGQRFVSLKERGLGFG